MKPARIFPGANALWAACLLALLLVGCGKGSSGSGSGGGGGNAAASSSEIKVGEYASLTGKEATFGISSHEGTLLAVEEINAAGGILGKQVKLITEDTQSKPGEPATVVNKLIARDGVIAVLGEVASSRSLEAAPICQKNKIPMISPSSTNPKVTETGDYIFRVCFIDPFQGTVMANFATKTLNAKKVAIFTDAKSDYSKGLAKFFKEKYLANGGTITSELDYNGGDKDFKAQLTTIRGGSPDAVFVPGYYTDVALICIQAKQLGLNVPLLGGDGWESEKLTEIGKESVEGNYFSTHYHPDVGTDLSKKFLDNYKKRFNGKVPDALAANGYDSMMMLADGIKRAGGTDGAKLRDALAATKDLSLVTGVLTINKQRDADKSAVILQIKNGGYKFLESIQP
ncbi:MAG: ABC transporter substrate-binding protein [Verrucomicrobiota bacterium]